MGQPEQVRQFEVQFSDDSDMTVHYANAANVRTSLDEFFITFGIATPPEIRSPEDLKKLGHVPARSVARFIISRRTMSSLLPLLQSLYEQQSMQLKQLEAMQRLQSESKGAEHE